MSESLHYLLVKSLGLPFCLQVIGCSEVVFALQYPTCEADENGIGRPPVVGENVLGVPYACAQYFRYGVVALDAVLLRSEILFVISVNRSIMAMKKVFFLSGSLPLPTRSIAEYSGFPAAGSSFTSL